MTAGRSGGRPVGEIDQIIKLPMVVDYFTEHHDGSCTIGFFPLAQEKTTPKLWSDDQAIEARSPGCFEIRTDNANLKDAIGVGQVFDLNLEPNMKLTSKWYERDPRAVLAGGQANTKSF